MMALGYWISWMKIAHLSFSDTEGGAAIGAYRLHRAMIDHGVNSHMFVLNRGRRDSNIYALGSLVNRADLSAAPRVSDTLRRAYGVPELPIRSFNLFGAETSRALNNFRPDIVQFHWIANNTIRIDDIPNIAAPIVWKMPDMWAYSGGEHYTNADEPQRHREGYDRTFPFRGELFDLDRFIWEYKRRYFLDLNLTIVSPSRFLAREAHESSLLNGYDCHVVPNPLAPAFLSTQPVDASEQLALRTQLGLPADCMIVMFAAFKTTERRKGFHHILTMLERHLPKRLAPDQVSFLVVGGAEATVEKLFGYDVITRPRISEHAEYIRYLQASDLILFPSEMDSTAMVVQEGLACGRPAVTFAVGGLVDLVHHGKSGFLATPYNSEQLADGIKWWFENRQKPDVASYCRALAQSAHDPYRCVERYMAIYDGVLTRMRTGQSFKTGRFFDRDSEIIETTPPRQFLIVDPSVKDKTDSSHNSESALAAYALAAAHGMRPRLIGNAGCVLSGVELEGVFNYSAYDKVRSQADVRGASTAVFTDLGHIARAEQVFSELDRLIAGKLSSRDAVYFPMTDRPLIDGLLLLLVARDSARLPTFHLNLMFERGEFLVGGYPLRAMLRALRNSRELGKRIFLYAETAAMVRQISGLEAVQVEVLPPLPMFNPDTLQAVLGADHGLVKSMRVAANAWHSGNAPTPTKSPGEFWVSALGRGRADKGWRRLPSIVAAVERCAGDANIRFLIQRPRKMDRLDGYVAELARRKNVTLLDEIIGTPELDALIAASDVMLLPYERSVYAHRGSAFAWKAVINRVPMVVSEGTALTDVVQYGNGVVAKSDEDFARAVTAICADKPAFEVACEKACKKYFAAASDDNPLIRNAQSDRLWKHETVLAVDVPPDQLASELGGTLNGVKIVHLIASGDLGGAVDLHPLPDEPNLLTLRATLQPDGRVLLPGVIRLAIAEGRFRQIVLGSAVSTSIRQELVCLGAAEYVFRSVQSTALESSDKEAGADAPGSLGAGSAVKFVDRMLYWLFPSRRWAGHLDAITGRWVKGWALDREHPEIRVPLEVRVDGMIVAQGFADRVREDLAVITSDIRRGFQIEIPSKYQGVDPARISVCATGADVPLRRTSHLDRSPNATKPGQRI